MSTSTSSDAQKLQNESTEEVAQQFLSKANDYFQSELKLVSSDYDCLTTMNTTSLDKYKQMHQTLERVNNTIKSINDSNHTNILSTHTQFEEIEDAMSNLESTIKNLDAYSRSLESQVKKFEKMSLTTRNKSSKKTKDTSSSFIFDLKIFQ